MNEAQAVLSQIAALRQPGSAAERVLQLEKQVTAGFWHNVLLDGALRQLADPSAPAPEVKLPGQLTARARRLLEQGRLLLARLRELGAALTALATAPRGFVADDPLAHYYRATVAMADTSLRMVQAFPDSPGGQLQLCEGLEAILTVAAERTAHLVHLVDERRRHAERIEILADGFLRLESCRPVDVKPMLMMAEMLLAEADDSAPLRWQEPAPLDAAAQPEEGEATDTGAVRLRPSVAVARLVAGHALNVAQVAARLVRHDPDVRDRPVDLVLAALLHDAGMVRIPEAILATPGPLSGDERRAVEGHARTGADLVSRLFPDIDGLADAALSHHERLDGTGYPDGLRDLQIRPFVRLLAVCDVYAAQCAPRPQRPARDTRSALADILALAERGELDRACAERLLNLSFYPIGTLVELADGAVGVVVAHHMVRRDLHTPACPVVALMIDAGHQPLPVPRHLDLAAATERGILRSLTPAEARSLIGKQHPELAA